MTIGETTANLDTASCWAALTARDSAADGRFFYGVRTTGVFCRPTCPSRRPKRENVAFFDSAAAARDAGFRACLRCRPDGPAASDAEAARMRALARFITAHADETLTLASLAAREGMSPFHLQRRFTAVLGVSPRQYQAAAKLRLLKANLREGEDVLGATFGAGYGSTSRVYEQVDGGLGMTPATYRAGGAGETIRHATADTPLGLVMLAASERGVCFVQFGATESALLLALRQEFPRATLAPAQPNAALATWLAALSAHLSANAPLPGLPLDLRGTAFQIKVWRFLLSVKPGEPVTYTAVARGIGAPAAVRAAAGACAANRIAVLVPCHRALRADGGLGGYRWGLERKRALLEAER
jgi:AraC family transcriptional regulator of adaptative response/methylated-DNA-[protein]-cysteine methyltransferase